MSKEQEVLSLLSSISKLCSASKAALGQSESPQQSIPTLAVLRKDFTSILTLLYTLTTKVSLTLRASEAAYSAAVPPLKDTAKHNIKGDINTCIQSPTNQ
ncbi:hypothetical protein BDY19DRAFT_1039192 [Irpex rosettiformis]|uniref:Uncharacterized protein n=1 Tax=Irpex rosettiformis TaxID=378272 RepID=A0ACB8UGT3_9APHY|nr:hypothetical protein BDY19DRAFT_1039192 [Irpex rosettiformis]